MVLCLPAWIRGLMSLCHVKNQDVVERPWGIALVEGLPLGLRDTELSLKEFEGYLWLWHKLTLANSQRLTRGADWQLTNHDKNWNISPSGAHGSACPGHLLPVGPDFLKSRFYRKPHLFGTFQESTEWKEEELVTFTKGLIVVAWGPSGTRGQGEPRELDIKFSKAQIMLVRAPHLWPQQLSIFLCFHGWLDTSHPLSIFGHTVVQSSGFPTFSITIECQL